jgi:hypothetical protein
MGVVGAVGAEADTEAGLEVGADMQAGLGVGAGTQAGSAGLPPTLGAGMEGCFMDLLPMAA